jgi:hypothetical protein
MSLKKEETKENQVKVGLFEEEDYFEEFDDEGILFIKIEWQAGDKMQDNIDVKRWQEDWEDEEINDKFDEILKCELEAFKQAS